MNIWETGPFEDDIAIDWLEDLHDSDTVAFFRHCLDLTDTDDLHHLACIGVVCTAAMLVSLLSEDFNLPLPKAAETWIADHQDVGSQLLTLLPDAIAGIDAVMSPESEMSMRWQDRSNSMHDRWKIEMKQIASQLQAISLRVR